MQRDTYPLFSPGDDAIVKGSFEKVTVTFQHKEHVRVKRAGGHWTYRAADLEPYCSGVCPIKPQGV